MKDLDRQLLKQSNVICNLRRKLQIISDIFSDNNNSANIDTTNINRDHTKINIHDTKDKKQLNIGNAIVDGEPTENTTQRTKIVNLHIH